jgi:poly-gamma-glutamate synthesis protein (capsule biosynthesis protein)
MFAKNQSFIIFFILGILLSSNQAYSALSFNRACERASSDLVISGVGDFLMHQPLQVHGYRYGFSTLWSRVTPFLNAADVNYANLETPLASGLRGRDGRESQDPGEVFDKLVYSGYPYFNTNPSLARDIAQFFDVVSTANNHSLDRGSLGVDKTIDALNAVNLPYTGTIKRGAERQWHTIVRQGRWNLAFIACTFSTNGVADPYNQTLDCFRNKSELLGYVQALANTQGVDAVIVTPHWGDVEYVNTPTPRNITLGKELINAGATAVIGTHPHVIQSWEKHTAPSGREGLIVYSTGNFISNQFFKNRIQTRMGLMVFIGLSKRGNEVWINGAKYLPLWMQRSPYEVVPIDQAKDAPRSMPDLAQNLLGAEDRIYSGQRLITNAECY